MLRISLSGDWNPREALTQLEWRSPERNNLPPGAQLCDAALTVSKKRFVRARLTVMCGALSGGRLLGRDVNSVTRADGLAGGFDTCHWYLSYSVCVGGVIECRVSRWADSAACSSNSTSTTSPSPPTSPSGSALPPRVTSHSWSSY